MTKDANALKLDELQKKHGKIVSVVVDGKLHAFRAPTLDEFEDHQESLGKKRRGVAFRELAQITCVTDLEELQKAFERKPALPVRVHDALMELAGSDIEVTASKD